MTSAPMMRVITTPWVRGAMTADDLAYLEQERVGRSNTTLYLFGNSANGPWTARLTDGELGDFEAKSETIQGALVKVIALVQA